MKCKKYAKLGLRQKQVMALLKQEGPMRFNDLSRALGVRNQNLVSVVASLAERGIAEKAPGYHGA
jgi:DNA-binding MarR family transcriptional regulator